MATKRKGKAKGMSEHDGNPYPVDEFYTFAPNQDGQQAAVDSMVALCPCKFNCSENENCECIDDCPCATRGDAFCKALCGANW